MLKEFRPAFLFLAKFLGIYLVGNVLYGLYIESYGERVDGITTWVAHQTAFVLQAIGIPTGTAENPHGASVLLTENAVSLLSVYEGCNGLNVMIIFVAFILAFGGPSKKMIWFLPLGVLLIHACNILRILLLYFVSKNYQQYFYYVHKYFFTAILYLVIFALWTIWVVHLNAKPREASAA